MTTDQTLAVQTTAAPGAPDAAEEKPGSSTHFMFTNKIFTAPGAHFSIARDTGDAVFNVHLGDVWGKVGLRNLRESFNISEGSTDARLLSIVEKGLKFVKEIRPGDSIPREILDGSASWKVEDRHINIARGRLTMQLLSWMTGSEATVTDRFKLEQIVEDPQTKSKAQQAFAELAKKFGLPEDRKQEIIDRVEGLVRELSYIEALRDRFGEVERIMSKIVQAKRTFKTDQTLQGDIARIQALSKPPVAQFDDIFLQIDGQTSEIIGMLKSYEAQVAFIRRMRDELHTNLMVWDEMITAWQGHDVDKGADTEAILKRTYQFMAKNFLITKVWTRS